MEKISERTVDRLGRIVLPVVIRKKLGIFDNTTLGIYLNDDSIVLTKSVLSCRLCGRTDGYSADFRICNICRLKIKNS